MKNPRGRPRPGRRPEDWALPVLVVLVILFAAPLFAHPGKMRDPENGDSLNYYLHLELARRSIVDYGQFPWWTPYVHGGLPLVGHPRDVSLSPVVVPALLLGPIAGVKVICLLIYLAAALGMFYLTRRVMRLGAIASVVASLVFVTSAWLPARLVGGNYDEWHLILFPLLLAFYYRSRDHWRYVIYGAAVLYVTLIDGKYVVAIFGLYLGLIAASEVVVSLVRRRPTVQPLGRVAAMFVLAALLAAVKVVPLAQALNERREVLTSSIDPPPNRQGLVPARFGIRAFKGGHSDFGTDMHDLGTWFAAPLLFLLACAAAPRRVMGWFALLILTLLLMHSRLVPGWMDLFLLLHRLPVFDSLRKPFKYFNFFALFIVCLGVAHAITFISHRRWDRWGLALTVGVITAGVPFIAHIRLNALIFSAEAEGPVVAWEDEDPGFYSVEAYDPLEVRQRERMFKDYFFVREGIGVLNWYDPMSPTWTAVPRRRVFRHRTERNQYWSPPIKRDPPEAYLAGSHVKASIRPDSWSPLGFTVDIKGAPADEAILIVNQNYNRRWWASAGEVFEDPDRRLLAVRLPAGTREVRLRYRPTDHYLAAAVSGLTLVGCIAALIVDWRRRRTPAPAPTESS